MASADGQMVPTHVAGITDVSFGSYGPPPQEARDA